MYIDRLEQSEKDDIGSRLAAGYRSGKDRFMHFTDVLTEYVGSGEWRNRSEGFLAICAKAAFLRGLYGYNQIIAKSSSSIVGKGYAAAAYCRQSLDPRWLNNLQTYVNQAWQGQDYIAFAELSVQLASVLIDLGYTERARTIALESIDKVTLATTKDELIRNKVQASLLRARILMAHIDLQMGLRDEAYVRLDSAEETAKVMDHELALTDIMYYRARILEESHEYDRAMNLVKAALQKYERMGYLQGVSDARNLVGILHMDRGQNQDARDQFEELLITQQQLNNQIGLARTLINVGEIDRSLDQFDQMEIYNQRALEISQEAEYMRGIATCKINLGDIMIRKGNFEEAITNYKESTEIAEASGMVDLLILLPFLLADANYMQEKFKDAMKLYILAEKKAVQTGNPLLAFTARVSQIMTSFAQEVEPEKALIEEAKSVLGDVSDWVKHHDVTLMRKVRAKFIEDPDLQSELCILFDREKTFECRVETQAPRKGCNGNLLWKTGGICPYLLDFIERLSK
ncbi:MAG: tetratricopeptide repeat protein [Candidatus Thorarchaeota archaeon]